MFGFEQTPNPNRPHAASQSQPGGFSGGGRDQHASHSQTTNNNNNAILGSQNQITLGPGARFVSSGAASFAHAVRALPENFNAPQEKAIGLPEVMARLTNMLQYWVKEDGPDYTASAEGPKAAERIRRYIQHLHDRGGDSAPRETRSRAHNLTSVPLDLRTDNENNNGGGAKGTLTSEELIQLATLMPNSVEEALALIPSLIRFRDSDVNLVLRTVRS